MRKFPRPLWTLITITVLLIQSTEAMAATSEGERLCDSALTAVHAQLKDTKDLVNADKAFSELLQRQRDDAFKMLDRQGPTMPWYFWTVLGGAATAVAFELRR